jgi:hypothetical protein
MAKISAKVSSRLVDGLKRYQPIVAGARSRDLNESDTSRIINVILADVFGYDKFLEITSEFTVRNTYCDLAIKLNDQPRLLIEVKAIGLDLKDTHIKQAVDYAANKGMDWVVLTNGVTWKVYKLIFGKPIDKDEVLTFDFTALNHRNDQDIEALFLISKEGLAASALSEYHEQRRAVNRFTLSALLQSEPILKVVRREISHLSPNVKVQLEDIQTVIIKEVLKREVVDADEAKVALKKVQRRIEKRHTEKDDKGAEGAVPAAAQPSSSATEDSSPTSPGSAA